MRDKLNPAQTVGGARGIQIKIIMKTSLTFDNDDLSIINDILKSEKIRLEVKIYNYKKEYPIGAEQWEKTYTDIDRILYYIRSSMAVQSYKDIANPYEEVNKK